MIRSRSALCLAAAVSLAAGCGETSLAPFGQLRSPVALALHAPSESLFIASLAANELRVFDARSETFLTAPAALFPLSIPTVPNPSNLAAADRFVFVLSAAGAEVGFVDTVVPRGSVGPRSVDGPDGLPIVLPVDMTPTAMAAFAGAYPWGPDGLLADHALVAGLDGGSTGGLLLALRPPVVDNGAIQDLPSPEALVELPGVFPAAVAIAPQGVPTRGLLDAQGNPVLDCRTVAIADVRPEGTDHAPGIWFTHLRVGPDGTLDVDPLDPARKIEVRVPVTLPDGTMEERVAPVRSLAFAPVPVTDSLLAAVAADPCAERSGRIFATLDPVYCAGALVCPDVAVIDLGGDPAAPGTIAVDAVTGGPAAYDFPGTQQGVVALGGPFDLRNAFDPAQLDAENQGAPLDNVPEVTLLTSSDGSIYYLSGGLGTYLVGPSPTDRAPSDQVFPVDAQEEGPGLVGGITRSSVGAGVGTTGVISVQVPRGATPRDEAWTAGFETALPGFDNVGTEGDFADSTLPIPADLLGAAVELQASADPRQADRVVPLPFSGLICQGFPIVEVGPDFVRFDATALENPEGCFDPALPVSILPPIDAPWILDGTVTGFVGRIPAGAPGARPTVSILSGSDLLFLFTPPEADVPRGSTYGFTTTDGFTFYRSTPELVALLPAAVEPFLRTGPQANRDPDWRVFVAYSGSDSLVSLEPEDPANPTLFQ